MHTTHRHETPCHSCCTKTPSRRTSDMTRRCLYHRHTHHTPTYACMYTHTNTHNTLSERPPQTYHSELHSSQTHIHIACTYTHKLKLSYAHTYTIYLHRDPQTFTLDSPSLSRPPTLLEPRPPLPLWTWDWGGGRQVLGPVDKSCIF